MLNMGKKLVKFVLEPILNFKNNRNYRLRTLYAYYIDYSKVNKNMVLYESYHGKNATGNPYAIFLELVNNPKYSNFTHVWALNSKDSESAKMLSRYKNVVVIKRETPEYVKYLAKAKYLVNNTSFPYYFQKKEEQVYVNTWHGTPLKAIGADAKEAGISDHGNIQRNLLHVDYLVSPNEFTYNKLLESNRIDGIYSGKIIDAGYPRIDLTSKANSEEMKKLLNLDRDKKVILYAPTWREWDKGKEQQAVERTYQLFKKLQDKYSDQYEVVLKVHYFVYKFFQEEGLEKYCIPDWIDTNELLSCVDVVITDYSSIFFDFLHTRKPVLFFMYDQEEYLERRGSFINFEELPGPICENIEEISQAIEIIDIIKLDYKKKYEEAIKKYCYNDDGMATRRVVDIIFENNENEYVKTIKNQDKKKVLIWGSGLATNGITMSLINLLNNIDYTKFDVSVIFASKLNHATISSLMRFNPKARVLYRKGTLNYKFSESYFHKIVMYFGLESKWVQKIVPTKLYKKELQRIVGNTKFDIAIDYCGYTPFWTLVLAHNEFEKKNIYLHSDMVADSKKVVNGKLRHKRNLSITFNLYKYFDKLICVSKDGLEINKEKLSKYGVGDKFVNVDNALDYEKVIQQSNIGNIEELFGYKYLLSNFNNSKGIISLRGTELPRPEEVNFITVGRLSPEKDHFKLINAFSKVNEQFNNTKLYIVGDGVLKKQLNKLIVDLNLEDRVILVGEMSNPFVLVNKCDCFVMSSNYEGQGLAILEALILKKPVISTNIPGPRGILEDGYGMLVDNSVEGLSSGMINFVLEHRNYKQFDYEEYNKRAMETFYKEVCEI